MLDKIKLIIRHLRKQVIKQPIFIVKSPKTLLEGKVGIVTGGSSGIGAAIAKAMTDAGCVVYIIGRDKSKLENVSKQIGCHYIQLDITDIQATEKAIEEFCSVSKIDILVNSAGVHGNDLFGFVKEVTFDSVINTNVKALYFISQAVANQMIKKNIKGHILNVSSASSLKPSWTPYEISKRAVNGITQGMAHKLIEHGIIVNGIAPGPTATNMLNGLKNNLNWKGNPSGRVSTPEEVAALALFMISGQGNGIVGDTFFISGGSGTICIDK